MHKQRVLVLDIETKPMLAYVWGLKDQNIALNQIKEDWSIIAFAAKWLGSKKVTYFNNFKHSDIALLKYVWKLLDEADLVITQYGSGFDCPRLNAQFILHGMKPPSPYKHLDTYRIAKRVADFTSNKLEYLTEKLCTKYKKLHHKKFPGMTLWTECLKGNKQAWKEMKTYNIHDVLATEELYMKLRAWSPDNAPVYLGVTSCPVCGSYKIIQRGWSYTSISRRKQIFCNVCGKWSKGPGERIR